MIDPIQMTSFFTIGAEIIYIKVKEFETTLMLKMKKRLNKFFSSKRKINNFSLIGLFKFKNLNKRWIFIINTKFQVQFLS